MLKLNSELRAQAREALQGNWVMAAVAALIYSAIVSATSYLPLVGTLLVGLPVAYGFTILMFSVIKGAKTLTWESCLKDSKTTAESWEP